MLRSGKWSEGKTMKAWKVFNNYTGYSTVVFAETRGKAKTLGMRTDCCEDAEFTEMYVYRVPMLDDEYRGHWEMDFYDDKDRLALVKKAGWCCEYPEDEECAACIAKDFCDYAMPRKEKEK